MLRFKLLENPSESKAHTVTTRKLSDEIVVSCIQCSIE